jgi:hypothetical protein
MDADFLSCHAKRHDKRTFCCVCLMICMCILCKAGLVHRLQPVCKLCSVKPQIFYDTVYLHVGV